MIRIEVVATLAADHRLSDDEVTDVVMAVVDDLDLVTADPSVGTARAGDELVITVSAAVDETDEATATARCLAAVEAAFRAAGVGTAGLTAHDVRSRVTPLQAA